MPIELPLYLVFLSITVLLLAMFSRLTVESAVVISRMTGIHEMAIGFLLLAVMTSAPEIAVAISAAGMGEAGLAIGNVFGSNVANVCLIIGAAALMRSVILRHEMEEVHIILFLISIIPLSLLLLEEASHLIGLVLIVAFPAFCWFCLKKRVAPRERPLSLRVGRLLLHLTLLMLGVLGVIGSAEYVVRSAVGVAELAGVATAVIGATVIAVGTSLPELSVDITAIKRGSTDLAIGDVLGSSLVNLTLVLGVTLTASPFVINMSVYQTLIVFLLLSNLLLWLFFERGKVGLPGGLTFLIIYFVFLTAVVMAR